MRLYLYAFFQPQTLAKFFCMRYNGCIMKIAFFGPRKIGEAKSLAEKVTAAIQNLIEEAGANIFLFGERDAFADLCYKTVTQFKENFPQLRRVCVRGRDEVLVQSRMEEFAARYDEMCCPDALNGKQTVPVTVRREAIIAMCDAIVVYRGGHGAGSNNIAAIYAQKSAAEQNKIIIDLT